ncbi:MAG: rhodanese-like domain-containing protein [Candidatus Obscuribacterales bacterium]|nr:rhodanese-like domain-containing protein [Candidatus Obscuribacterales bacterium]
MLLVDLRLPADFADEHIAGSINMPIAVLQAELSRQGIQRVPIYLICSNGSLAYKAADILASLGFERLVVMAGGLLAWRVFGFPLVGRKH